MPYFNKGNDWSAKFMAKSPFKQDDDIVTDDDSGDWEDVTGTIRGLGNYEKNTNTGEIRSWVYEPPKYADEARVDSMRNVVANTPMGDWDDDDDTYDEKMKLREEKMAELKAIKEEEKIDNPNPRKIYNYPDRD